MVALSVVLTLLSLEAVSRVLAPPWLTHRMLFLNPAAGSPAFGTDRDWKTESKSGHFWRFTPGTVVDVTHLEYHNVAHIDEYGGRATSGASQASSGILV